MPDATDHQPDTDPGALDAPIATLEDGIRQLRALRHPSPHPPPPEPPPEASPLLDGRYEGGNSDLYVELRLDASGAGVVSADVFRTSSRGRDYVASVRSAPGTRIDQTDRRWPAAWQDSLGAVTTGSVRVQATPGTPDSMTATFVVDSRLNGLPPGTDLVVAARRTSERLRRVGIELETEEGVQLPGEVAAGSGTHTFRSCLEEACFEVLDAGSPTAVPAQPDGWDLSNTYTVLDDLMKRTAQASLSAAVWELHLLMLGRSSLDGLLGVMFDSGDVLPRQGVAIFVGEIRARVAAAEQDRKIIQTTVHELGHALNLAHRFERSIGRADSTSFMNYDWRYLGGNHRDDFWRKFAFTFDPDELEFLRHAPRTAVMPGTADFHSVNYWADGKGGYSPYYPETPVPGFALTLTPPQAGSVFAFGQPLFLQVALENRTQRPIDLPPQVLDPKAGFLELLVRRRTGAPARGLVDATPFVPLMQRCYDLTPAASDALAAGATLRNNLNLTFGSGGFAFAEPGEYDITPLLSFVVRNDQGEPEDLVIRGEPLGIRVAHPHTMGEEHDAQVLFRPDVGVWFALGGSDCLAGAGEALEGVKDRRRASLGEADPVVAAITRAAGIHAGRPSVRFMAGRYTCADGDHKRAATLLGSLDDTALRNFDAHTAENTKLLADVYARLG